ncbi:MAG: hypothetical protein JW819_04895 [Candidatus Krumholzibacteriota bacterium]|nr:hypothetical protein [Candidatus Krumholzibacteriota bacterium]
MKFRNWEWDEERQQHRAYCPECHVGFPAWAGTCPVCKVRLREEAPPDPPPPGAGLSYGELIAFVERQGGVLTIPLRTEDVIRAKKRSFPYLGRGYAWAASIRGDIGGHPVALRTREVGLHKAAGFPYRGYGFAWARSLAGHVAGNPATLTASRVEMRKEWGFPYFGYGFAWVQTMHGQCGDRLRVRFAAADVATEKTGHFPGFGFGYAWAAAGELIVEVRG